MAMRLLEDDQGAYFTTPVLRQTMKDRKIPQRSVGDAATQRRRLRKEVEQSRLVQMTLKFMPRSFPHFLRKDQKFDLQRR
jgi:hypothetical protein